LPRDRVRPFYGFVRRFTTKKSERHSTFALCSRKLLLFWPSEIRRSAAQADTQESFESRGSWWLIELNSCVGAYSSRVRQKPLGFETFVRQPPRESTTYISVGGRRGNKIHVRVCNFFRSKILYFLSPIFSENTKKK